MKKIPLAVACIFLYAGARAQTDSLLRHKIRLASSGSFNHTEDGMTYLFNNALSYSYKQTKFTLNSNSTYIYGANPTDLTNNDFTTSLNFNYFSALPKVYYWGLANFTSSWSLKIKEQLQTGAGLAYRFIDNGKTYLALSEGILFERSNVIQDDKTALDYQTFRNSLRLQFSARYKDLVTFSSVGYYQPSLNYGGDFIVNANASLAVKIWRWLNFTTAVTYNNVSRTQRENLLFTYGLVAERLF